jgi:hypothetical protein
MNKDSYNLYELKWNGVTNDIETFDILDDAINEGYKYLYTLSGDVIEGLFIEKTVNGKIDNSFEMEIK